MPARSLKPALTPPGVAWGAATSRGGRRSNQDRFGAVRSGDGFLFVVCDGMGGHAGGAVAATHAARRFLQERPGDEEGLRRLAAAVSEELVRVGSRDPALRGLGTTLVALLVRGGSASWVSVGDSRLYMLRRGILGLLAEPHDLLGILLREGVLEPEEAEASPLRGRLTSHLGRDRPEVSSGSLRLARGDRLALVTDGVVEGGEARIAMILGSESPRRAAEVLVRGVATEDNATAVVLEIERLEEPCSASS